MKSPANKTNRKRENKMAMYLANKEEVMKQGKAIVLELIEKHTAMVDEFKTAKIWFDYYITGADEMGFNDFMEYINSVASNLVKWEEIENGKKDDGTLFNLVQSVFLHESMKWVAIQQLVKAS